MNYEFCDGVTHTVKKGDTLYEISRMHNVPLAMLLRANPYVDVFNLQVGDTICVPTGNRQMMPYPVNGREYMDVGKTQERSIASSVEDSGNSGRSSAAGVFDMSEDTPGSNRGGYETTGTMSASSGNNATDTSGMPSGRNPESASEMLPVPFENSTEGQSGIMAVPSKGGAGNVSGMPPVPSGSNTGNASGMSSVPSGNSTGNMPSMPYTGGMVSMPGNNGTGRFTEGTAGSSAGRGYFDQDDDDGDDDCEKSWDKYVVMPGDTLADVLANMKGDAEDFLEKNKPDTIYMLPGVAYYICK